MIRNAKAEDLALLHELDYDISPDVLVKAVESGHIMLAEKEGEIRGWLRWNLFWDNTPFLNLLYIRDPWKGQGIGQALLKEWEEKLMLDGYQTAMTSAPVKEFARKFFEGIGYEEVGEFKLPGESQELLMSKKLG